jgi:hypothetical protein
MRHPRMTFKCEATVGPTLGSIAVPYAEPRMVGPRTLGPQAGIVPVGDPHTMTAVLSIVTESYAVESP